jgi:plastocyanin
VSFAIVGESTFHTFTVEALGIDVEVNGSETVDFSFTFDTAGTYEVICIPHEALGMVGTITVN